MIDFLIYALLAVFAVVSVLLVLVVLMQRPRSEGLGAAFGGGVTDSVFGAQTSDVLTKLTVWLGGLFFVLTLTLAILYSHRSSSSLVEELEKADQTVEVAPTDASETASSEPSEEPTTMDTTSEEAQEAQESVDAITLEKPEKAAE
ncbi:MAG: preprotein translocase subunit SecG [Verrucomicrobiota bacterium]